MSSWIALLSHPNRLGSSSDGAPQSLGPRVERDTARDRSGASREKSGDDVCKISGPPLKTISPAFDVMPALWSAIPANPTIWFRSACCACCRPRISGRKFKMCAPIFSPFFTMPMSITGPISASECPPPPSNRSSISSTPRETRRLGWSCATCRGRSRHYRTSSEKSSCSSRSMA